MTYESHKKAGLHPVSRKYIFGKTKGGVKLIPHPNTFLDLISPDLTSFNVSYWLIAMKYTRENEALLYSMAQVCLAR